MAVRVPAHAARIPPRRSVCRADAPVRGVPHASAGHQGPGDSWSWPSTGASGLPRCDWEPCVDGCCLQWSEIEQTNTAVSELSYIVDHFLRPHATASKDGRADFAPFIFNHRVDGTIAALRGDSRELFLIIADNNDITTRALVAGDPELW